METLFIKIKFWVKKEIWLGQRPMFPLGFVPTERDVDVLLNHYISWKKREPKWN